MKSIIALVLAASISSSAFAKSDCSLIPSLLKDSRAQAQMAGAYEENFKTLQEITGDAKRLRNASSALGISSGILFLGGGIGVASALGPGGAAIAGDGFLVMGTIVIRGIPTLVGGLIGGLIAGDAGMVGMLLGHVDAIYYIGNGIYQLVKGADVYEVDMKEVNKADKDIKGAIAQLSKEIENKMDNPPSKFSNAVSFGGKAYRHFSTISQMAEARARLQYDLSKLTRAKLEILEVACANQ